MEKKLYIEFRDGFTNSFNHNKPIPGIYDSTFLYRGSINKMTRNLENENYPMIRHYWVGYATGLMYQCLKKFRTKEITNVYHPTTDQSTVRNH